MTADTWRSLRIPDLRAAYVSGSLTPVEVARFVSRRIADHGDGAVWTELVPAERLRERAEALDLTRIDDLPLFGIPFAVKDNIDVAGMDTTAACEAFRYRAAVSSPVVTALLAAGALLVGKTNLDQFATGLSGARSPFGTPRNPVAPGLIPGGSSSGSAVAVAARLVSFALGTDTAGSGRVPAALTGIVGVKPTRGRVSTEGVVPACRSLDCVSVFALSVPDGQRVLDSLSGECAGLPSEVVSPSALTLAIPDSIECWGDRGERAAWSGLLDRLGDEGVRLVPVPVDDFLAAGSLLYGGPWVAERLEAVSGLLSARPEMLHPVIRELLEDAVRMSALDVFEGASRIAVHRTRVAELLRGCHGLLAPTVTETFTVEEMVADPIVLNARLGTWTTFTNLLDLAAVAVPVGVTRAGVPFGVTLHGPAGADDLLLGIGTWLEGGELRLPGVGMELAVVGAHLEGQPLHQELLGRGACLTRRTGTSKTYRLMALPGEPARPGLVQVGPGGASIEVEVYRLPLAEVGGFVSGVRRPLAIGQVELIDGSVVHGFVCEPSGILAGTDITAFGGWRAYRESVTG
jgi:allophanate hydrolase